MPRYTGINHIAMATNDIGRTIRFWRDLLGFRMVVGMGRAGFRTYFFSVSEHDMIGFFEWDRVQRIPEKDHGAPVSGPFAFDHISFEVASLDDLWEIYDKLDAAGFWVSEPLDHEFIYSIYAFDPNNIPIEFSTPTGKLDVRRRPQMADRSPPAEAREGPEPQSGHWPEVAEPTPVGERMVFPGEGAETLGAGSGWTVVEGSGSTEEGQG